MSNAYGLSNDDYRILIDAYDFMIGDDDHLCGLTAGDQHYEKTGLKVTYKTDKAAIYEKSPWMKTDDDNFDHAVLEWAAKNEDILSELAKKIIQFPNEPVINLLSGILLPEDLE